MKEIVRCAIVKDDKVLVLFRLDHGEYCFPGGKVDVKESKEESLIRETKEEIGSDIKIKKHFSGEEFLVGAKKFKQEIFLAEIINGEPRILEPENYNEILWMKIKDYKKYKIAPHVELFCEGYLG